MSSLGPAPPLSSMEKIRLATRIWRIYGQVVLMRRRPLPEQVERLKAVRSSTPRPVPPTKVSRAIHRGLRFGRLTPRCLPKALIMFRILFEQGDHPVLVIGLPPNPRSPVAHAWIEVAGQDVGPPPGRGGHDQLVRYE